MKKLFTLCLFTMALFLGAQNISAQEITRTTEEIAKENTIELSKEFGLNGNQEEMVFRAFLSTENAKKDLINASVGEEEKRKIKAQVKRNFDNLMKEALSEEQFNKFNTNFKGYLKSFSE